MLGDDGTYKTAEELAAEAAAREAAELEAARLLAEEEALSSAIDTEAAAAAARAVEEEAARRRKEAEDAAGGNEGKWNRFVSENTAETDADWETDGVNWDDIDFGSVSPEFFDELLGVMPEVEASRLAGGATRRGVPPSPGGKQVLEHTEAICTKYAASPTFPTSTALLACYAAC